VKREDALYNWLQIQIVADARPDDRSAADTAAFFAEILRDDHQAQEWEYRREGDWYTVRCVFAHEVWEHRYPAEEAESLLAAIANEPRYNE
jgi:hypothetical protein